MYVGDPAIRLRVCLSGARGDCVRNWEVERSGGGGARERETSEMCNALVLRVQMTQIYCHSLGKADRRELNCSINYLLSHTFGNMLATTTYQ